MNSIALILAAGKGTRMKSELPKPVVSLNGKPMVEYIIDAFRNAGINEVVLAVGYKSQIIKNTLGNLCTYLDIQGEEQECTYHVLSQFRDKMSWSGKDIFIFVGDSPLITKDTINYLHSYHHITNSDCTILTADLKKYLLHDKSSDERNDTLIRYVEDKNRGNEDVELVELFSSHFIFKADCLFALLDELEPEFEKRKYSLTDILEIFFNKDLKIDTLAIGEHEELADLNTPEDLIWAEEILNRRRLSKKTKTAKKSFRQVL